MLKELNRKYAINQLLDEKELLFLVEKALFVKTFRQYNCDYELQ